MYRKTSQHNDAIKRQIDANPEAFKAVQEAAKKQQQEDDEAVKSQKNDEEVKESVRDDLSEKPASEVHKRPAIDKQVAFLEFKQTEEGCSIEQNILHFR